MWPEEGEVTSDCGTIPILVVADNIDTTKFKVDHSTLTRGRYTVLGYGIVDYRGARRYFVTLKRDPSRFDFL